MTVKYVTHPLTTGDITIMGRVSDVATVRGKTISQIGAIVGQEQQNPAAVHVNLESVDNQGTNNMVTLILGLDDALELGIHLVAMGIENQPAPSIDDVRERVAQLVTELDRTLQVSS
ncbi:hypothetical protein [Trichothermofontia sp.]